MASDDTGQLPISTYWCPIVVVVALDPIGRWIVQLFHHTSIDLQFKCRKCDKGPIPIIPTATLSTVQAKPVTGAQNLAYGYIPVANTQIDSLPAHWWRGHGKSSRFPKKEVINVASFINYHGCYTAVAQQSFHKQRSFMLSILEVVRPGSGLSSHV